MTTQQPEALRLAEILEGGYSLAWLYEHGGYEVSAELRRQHARITALEAQLEAVGAGGVGPLIASAGFDAADMATASAHGFRDGVASAASWISVDARLPEPNTPVLLDIGKMFPLRALWAGKHTVRVATDVDDCGEYDEETDEYYCPEGWYEWNEHEEVHWAVSETPRAWRELPQPLPAAPGPTDGESNG